MAVGCGKACEGEYVVVTILRRTRRGISVERYSTIIGSHRSTYKSSTGDGDHHLTVVIAITGRLRFGFRDNGYGWWLIDDESLRSTFATIGSGLDSYSMCARTETCKRINTRCSGTTCKTGVSATIERIVYACGITWHIRNIQYTIITVKT